MIDERAVHAAKFVETLRDIRPISRLREGEFEQFVLMVIGLKYVSTIPGSWPDKVIYKAKQMFLFLNKSAKYLDETELREAWFETYTELSLAFDIYGNTQVPREFGSTEALLRICHLLEKTLNYQYSDREKLLNFFDEIFHRFVGRISDVKYRSGDTAAALASHLSRQLDQISEYFGTTGEFAVIRQSVLNLKTYTQLCIIENMNFFIFLRLILHGIQFKDQTHNKNFQSSFSDRGFLLIDHPRRTITKQNRNSTKWLDHQSSLEALNYLIQKGMRITDSLIVVPGTDRTAKGWRQYLREHLVKSRQLLAVIDLPSNPNDRSSKQISAWYLGKSEYIADQVLMVDLNGLLGRVKTSNFNMQIGVVASIISLWTQGSWSLPQSGNLELNDEINSLVNAHFSDGYRDIEGVCKQIQVEEIAEKFYALTASHYLGKVEKNKKHKIFMPLLNSAPVLKALHEAPELGSRIYIIGNNGEGKSILLRDLAEDLIREGCRVVGISFGLTDRFAFSPPRNGNQPFIYVGARTAEQSITLGRTEAELNRLVRDIHVNEKKLEVFNSIVRFLGFGERRYLVPISRYSSVEDNQERYAELIQFSENAQHNFQILQKAGAKSFELGLMRQESQHTITTFKELSSGEQQLLTLALKLTAYANSRTVILVDEPELSLHVSWQRAIPGMLEIIGTRMNCSMVIATHSPIVVTSAKHYNDKCFVARKHSLIELGHRQRRSVETALFDGFQTYTANNRQVHERCAAMVSESIQRANNQLTLKEIHLPFYESLYNELKSMENTILLAGSAHFPFAKADLELVARTHAAIKELEMLTMNTADEEYTE